MGTPNEGGATPLHLAALKGHMEEVWVLLGAGAYVGMRNEGGATPLQLAALKLPLIPI